LETTAFSQPDNGRFANAGTMAVHLNGTASGYLSFVDGAEPAELRRRSFDAGIIELRARVTAPVG
jgi:hypothetical protein